MKAKSGWFRESLRHSQAKRLGKTNPSALQKGIRVEKEHKNTLKYLKLHPKTPLPTAESMIAKDHLKEDPNYYNKLQAVEKKPTGDYAYYWNKKTKMIGKVKI